MTNENGLQFGMTEGAEPTLDEIERRKCASLNPMKPDLLEQIDMSHDEVVRRARNEAFEEAAKICEMIGKDWKEASYYTKLFAAEYLASQIRYKIKETK